MKSFYPIKFVACHRLPERSFFYKGKQFPVCARCTGIVLGYIFFPLFLLNVISLSLLAALALNIPAYIDGVTQGLGWRTSTNPLRFATGLLSGIGQVGVITVLGKWTAKLLLSLMGV